MIFHTLLTVYLAVLVALVRDARLHWAAALLVALPSVYVSRTLAYYIVVKLRWGYRRPEDHDNNDGSVRPHYVLITGASSGLGLAMAQRLAAEGFAVLGGVRSPDDARQLMAVLSPISPRCRAVRLDVTSPVSVSAAQAEVAALCGPSGLFALINNAGVQHNNPLETEDPAVGKYVFDVNFFGTLAVTRAFLPLLRQFGAQAAHGFGARILNISSFVGFFPTPYSGYYCASKFALEGASDCLAAELSGQNVRVVVIEPGVFRTAMLAKHESASRACLTQLQRDEDVGSLYSRNFETMSRMSDMLMRLTELPPTSPTFTDAIVKALLCRTSDLQTRYLLGRFVFLYPLVTTFVPDKLSHFWLVWVFDKVLSLARRR